MVGLFKALLSLLLFAAFSAAQNDFNVSNPSSTNWWVAKSQNVLTWDCNSSQAVTDATFTVLINNANQNVFVGPLAIIAIQQNFQCSVTISQDQFSQPPGPGYVVLFADPLNSTHVYATSQPFEIKPLGSLYPSQVNASASAGSGTATTSSTASASPSSGAAHNSRSPSFFGLTGIMGLLTVGLLGGCAVAI